ncbi:MAG: endonuclease/exonuclease/phosphatase family protein [Clostridia bacterium]|nr:endonuclease/exonuclease/phosphatase family protein [Clostridia bacterium]
MVIKAVTFNIQHCAVFPTGKIDFDAFAEKILSFDADIIGLNEVRGAGVREDYQAQAEILAKKTGYQYYFAKATDVDGANPYGNAVLTRLPVKSFETVPIPDPDPHGYDGYYETRCLLKMTLANPAVTCFITHFGLNPDEQENALRTVLDNLGDGNTVLMGDLNVTPDSPVLARLREHMADAATAAEPGAALLSFPSDKPDRKIDYIFTKGNVTVRSCRNVSGVLSDHLPLEAVMEIGPSHDHA